MFPAKFTDRLNWLYLDEGFTPIFSRLVGLISLPIAGVVWFFSHSGCNVGSGPYPGPFNVPAWRFGSYLLQIPMPPEPVNILIFGLFAVCALLLIAGKNIRALYIYMAIVLGYYCARDFFVCMLHWILLDFLFLLALAFRAPGKSGNAGQSPTRRLLQLTICSCYLFGVLQKIFYPDFWLGYSLEASFYDGFSVTAPYKNFFITHPQPMSFWQAAAVALLVGETFIGLGLFFKRTRIAACLVGLFLHGGILLMMDPLLSLFSVEMWLGYLAFFERGERGPEMTAEAPARGPVSTLCSLVYITCLILVPLRIYYLPGPPAALLTLFERTPWTFGMFLMRQKQESITLIYEDKEGVRHTVEPVGRMKTASNDNELLSIAQYIRQNNPTARAISVNVVIVVNEKRRVLRTLVWDNLDSQSGSTPRITVTDAGDYCRGAADRNPDAVRRP